ncbi:MAG: K(+)-transporting ATPase subunit C [Polyangiales bacterium]
MSKDLIVSVRAWLSTLVVCAVLYPLVTLAFGQLIVPGRAEGSLIRDASGQVVGSRLIAQAFERPEYLWPRPSAVNYDAAATGGSNLAPSNPALSERAKVAVTQLSATSDHPVPGELVAASGSGMDPHISLDGALYQVPRIAGARGIATARIEELIREHAAPNPWSPTLVNVLETNIALDSSFGPVAR